MQNKIKDGGCPCAERKDEKSVYVPYREITISIQGIKRKLLNIEEKLRRFAKRVSDDDLVQHGRQLRHHRVVLKGGHAAGKRARRARADDLYQDKHTPNTQSHKIFILNEEMVKIWFAIKSLICVSNYPQKYIEGS